MIICGEMVREDKLFFISGGIVDRPEMHIINRKLLKSGLDYC